MLLLTILAADWQSYVLPDNDVSNNERCMHAGSKAGSACSADRDLHINAGSFACSCA